ncbi:MAG: hypothetical protein KDI79_04780 [Anaerolineae bacterium]|nr:hypothetical protein [Anaerolineae bacterium]
MTKKSETTKLLDRRYFTLVTRLLVDKDGNVQHGNLIALDEKIVGQFRQLDELPDLIKAWIEKCIADAVPPLD